MVYKQFQDLQLSALGFGAMRLPLRPDGSGSIDQTELNRMVDAAMAAGVNGNPKGRSADLWPGFPERPGIWRISSPDTRMSTV